jgi:hypothetical protein
MLLGSHNEPVYVGKAANLRRRLIDHARSRRSSRAHDVRWIECANERDARCREADAIVAIAPTLNASMATDAFTFVRIEPTKAGRMLFSLTEKPRGRSYGAFPHLGKGKASWRAVRTNAGYSALLRLLWAADPGRGVRMPAKLRGKSPPVHHESAVGDTRALHDLLSGRSDRLLRGLGRSLDEVPDYMQQPLLDDLIAAAEFYDLGPRALRRLRARHGLAAGPVDRETFVRIVVEDLRASLGDFELPPFHADPALVGARTARSMHMRAVKKGANT